jgi:hypothetical protein
LCTAPAIHTYSQRSSLPIGQIIGRTTHPPRPPRPNLDKSRNCTLTSHLQLREHLRPTLRLCKSNRFTNRHILLTTLNAYMSSKLPPYNFPRLYKGIPYLLSHTAFRYLKYPFRSSHQHCPWTINPSSSWQCYLPPLKQQQLSMRKPHSQH